MKEQMSEHEPTPINKLVMHMIEIEPFLRSTMQKNEDLEKFLNADPSVNKAIKRISKGLKEILFQVEDNEEPLIVEYMIAFANMVNSKGYSIIKLLNTSPELASYLQETIDEIDSIYYQYLLYQKAQLEKKLEELEAANSSSHHPQITCVLITSTKLRFTRKDAIQHKAQIEDNMTDYHRNALLTSA